MFGTVEKASFIKLILHLHSKSSQQIDQGISVDRNGDQLSWRPAVFHYRTDALKDANGIHQYDLLMRGRVLQLRQALSCKLNTE
jgi:hypothetical protein